MSEDLIPINLWLGGRSYRIRIKAHEEEAVRKAVKQADDKIAEMRTHYAGKDDQDFVAMCLLMYAADGVTDTPTSLIADEIKSITAKIEKALSKEE